MVRHEAAEALGAIADTQCIQLLRKVGVFAAAACFFWFAVLLWRPGQLSTHVASRCCGKVSPLAGHAFDGARCGSVLQ